jgi:hypothetical protein
MQIFRLFLRYKKYIKYFTILNIGFQNYNFIALKKNKKQE